MPQISYDVSDDFLKGSVTDAFGTAKLDLELAFNEGDGRQVFVYRSEDGRRAFGVAYDPATGERTLRCERSEARLIRELKAAFMRTSRHLPDSTFFLSPRMCAAGFFHQEAVGTTAFYAVKEIGAEIYCAAVTVVEDDGSPAGTSYACRLYDADGRGAWRMSEAPGANWRAADMDAALRDFADARRRPRDRGELVFYSEIGKETFSRIVFGDIATSAASVARVEALFPTEGEMKRLSREHRRKKRDELKKVECSIPTGSVIRQVRGGLSGKTVR